MPPHGLSQRPKIRWAAGGCLNDGRDFAEIVRPENARRYDGKHSCLVRLMIVEAMNRAAANAKHFAGADIDPASVYSQGQYARDAEYRFLVTIVTVRDGHVSGSGNIELEDRDGSAGLMAFHQESHCQLSDTDLFVLMRRVIRKQSVSPIL